MNQARTISILSSSPSFCCVGWIGNLKVEGRGVKRVAKALPNCSHWCSTTAVLLAIWDFWGSTTGCNLPLFPRSPQHSYTPQETGMQTRQLSVGCKKSLYAAGGWCALVLTPSLRNRAHKCCVGIFRASC